MLIWEMVVMKGDMSRCINSVGDGVKALVGIL